MALKMLYLQELYLRFHYTLNMMQNIGLNLTMHIKNHLSMIFLIININFTNCKQKAPITDNIPLVLFDKAIK